MQDICDRILQFYAKSFLKHIFRVYRDIDHESLNFVNSLETRCHFFNSLTGERHKLFFSSLWKQKAVIFPFLTTKIVGLMSPHSCGHAQALKMNEASPAFSDG